MGGTRERGRKETTEGRGREGGDMRRNEVGDKKGKGASLTASHVFFTGYNIPTA